MNVTKKGISLLVVLMLILSIFPRIDVFADENPCDETFDSGIYSAGGGYEAPPFDTSNTLLKGKSRLRTGLLAEHNTYPTSYSLFKDSNNSVDEMTSIVKDQADWGDCWAFSSLGSAESSLYQNGQHDVDFSERHLAYFTYNGKSNPNAPEDGTEGDTYCSATPFDGGNFYQAISTLARGTGAEFEDTVPSPTRTDFKNGKGKSFETVSENYHFASHYQLKDGNFLPNKDANGNLDGSAIKDALKGGTSVSVTYASRANYASTYYKKVDGVKYPTYYCSTGTSSNADHAVQIVGWDDRIPASKFTDVANGGKNPRSAGGWLIKNSWGEQNAYRGGAYFYISYEDPTLTQFCAFTMDNTEQDSPTYAHNYQYDGTSVGNMIGPSTGPKEWKAAAKMANVFTAKGNQTLDAAAFYTTDADANYSIQVYTNVSGTSPVNGTKAFLTEQSGIETYPGYHTIVFDQSVKLIKDQKFSVVVTIQNPNGKMPPVAMEYNILNYSKADINPGESFYNNGSIWQDVAGMNTNYGNVCLKAFTNDQNVDPNPSISITPFNVQIMKGYTHQFSATVSGMDNKSITWSVTGNSSNSTTIDSTGKLTVAAGETAATLTVRATSSTNASVYAEAKVTVLPLTQKEITMFNMLKLSVEYQTVAHGTPFRALKLPSELKAIVDGIPMISVPISKWESNIPYNPTIAGTYRFTPVLDNGYVLKSENKLPQISVTVLKAGAQKDNPWYPGHNHSGGGNGGGSSDTSNSSTATVATQSNVVVTQTGDGVTTASVTVATESAMTISNHVASFSTTASFNTTIVENNSTAQKHAKVEIVLPKSTIINQLSSGEVNLVDMTVKVPSNIINGAPNIDITMNMDSEVLQAAKLAKKDVVVNIADNTTGKERYTWTFNGAALANTTLALNNINMALNINSSTSDAAVSRTIPSSVKGAVLTFANNGVLPSSTTVKVYVGDQGFIAEQALYLYYYNSAANSLEKVDNPVCMVDANGYASVVINHCSQYVLLPQQVSAVTTPTLDTGKRITVRAGKTYQFKVTASYRPVFVSGNSSVFRIFSNGSRGKDYFYRAVAVGKIGDSTGFYINGEKTPRSVAVIVK